MLGDLASGPVMRCAASIANGFVVNRSKTLRAQGDQGRDPRAAKYAANKNAVLRRVRPGDQNITGTPQYPV
jgi:hypothetical protein